MNERAIIVDRFAEALSARLGRSANGLREDGLRADDFGRGACQIQWEDGSEATFRYAFVVHDTETGRVGVFTEHYGYFDLNRLGIETVIESVEGIRSIIV